MYEVLDRTMPVILPRFSATLFRKEDLAGLEGANLPAALAVRGRNAVENQAAADGLPETARDSLETLKQRLTEIFAGVKESLARTDPSLSGAVDASLRKALAIQAYLTRKTSAAMRRKLLTGGSALSRSLDFLFPGALQESKYNFLYFTGQAPGFLRAVLDLIAPFDFRHQLIEL
jgi:hypothetical protein